MFAHPPDGIARSGRCATARRAMTMRRMTREQRMGALFAVGSACFVAGPFPGYADLVGPQADAITFFVGSIFFTLGGAAQVRLAWRPRYSADWWTATIQSAGTLCFNVSTFLALHTALSNPQYDRLVWRPDAVGSICFLVSGIIGFAAARPRWWMPTINLLGCVLFGISAIAGYVVPQSGSIIDLAAANWNTALGAACFLACGLGALRPARTPAAA
jgi:hypothetical protein